MGYSNSPFMQYLRNLFNATAHCDSNYLFIPLAVIAKMLFPALPAPLSCLLLCNNRCFISLYASSIDQANGFVLPTAYPIPLPPANQPLLPHSAKP